MKIFIVGSQGTLKSELYSLLKDSRFKCGKNFTNNTEADTTYNKYIYKYYTNKVVEELFEQDAYVFICNSGYDPEGIFTGLDLDEYENNDVFVFTPEQFINVKPQYIKGALIVWLDGKRKWRMNNIRYAGSNGDEPTYNVYDVEKVENTFVPRFYKILRKSSNENKNVLYFYEEEPRRVEFIVKTAAKDPKALKEIINKFNDNI